MPKSVGEYEKLGEDWNERKIVKWRIANAYTRCSRIANLADLMI